MRTQRVRVNPVRPEPEAITEAASILKSGGLVAFPTETVYGLGADGLNPDAVESIFQAKGRPLVNPVSLHIADEEQLTPLVTELPGFVKLLIERFWPGPLTLVLARSSLVPDAVTAGTDRVGIRMPDQPVARALIRAAGVPVAAPSANVSGRMSPTTADHVLGDLDGRIHMVLDAGPTGAGIESTVLDCTAVPARILRPGAVAVEDLAEIPELVLELGGEGRPDLPRWQISARVIVCEGPRDQRLACLARAVDRESGSRLAILVTDETMSLLESIPGATMLAVGSDQDPGAVAGRLFSLMRELDADHDVLIVEGIADQGLGRAVMDRLRSAAGRPVRILVVCTGNTCRSPMAERLLAAVAARQGVPVEVRSAGVAASGGPASPQAEAVMADWGLDLSSHRSQQLAADAVDWADVVLAMTESHRHRVLELVAAAERKTYLFGSYPNCDSEQAVADPFGGALDTYRQCRDQLADRAEAIIRVLGDGLSRSKRSDAE